MPEKPPPTMAMTRGVRDPSVAGAAVVDWVAAIAAVFDWVAAIAAPWLWPFMQPVFAPAGHAVDCETV